MLPREASVDSEPRVIVALDLAEMQDGNIVKIDDGGTVKDGKIEGEMIKTVAFFDCAQPIRFLVLLRKAADQI